MASFKEMPPIEMLKEPPARKGFLELAGFQKLREQLPEYLKPVVTLGFYTGMRLGRDSKSQVGAGQSLGSHNPPERGRNQE